METFGLRDLHIEWKDAVEPGARQESKLDIGYQLDQMADPALVRIGMTFSDVAKGPKGQEVYKLSVHIMGFFRLAQGLTDEEKGRLLLGNGLAMLYSSLRGLLLPVTGCFPPGFRYILPTVNLQEVIREVESRRTQATPPKKSVAQLSSRKNEPEGGRARSKPRT